MTKMIILLTLLFTIGCTTSPEMNKNEIHLEDNKWEPVNKNHIKRGF